MPLHIHPSMMVADFARLGEELRSLDAGGSDGFHFDVMDGQFVPNLTFGALVLRALRPLTTKPFFAHLMVYRPEALVADMAAAGSDAICIHFEATPHLHRTLQSIRAHDAEAWVAINPATSVEALADALGELDGVLVMSVNPGFAGQAFLPFCVEKVRRLRELMAARGIERPIGMDGGIGADNVAACVAAGASLLAVGSTLWQCGQPLDKAVGWLRGFAPADSPTRS